MKKSAIFYTILLAARLGVVLASRCRDSAKIPRIGSVAVGKIYFKNILEYSKYPLSCQGYPLWSL